MTKNSSEKEFLESALKPEFIQKMKETENEETVKVENFAKRYGIKK